MNKLDNKLQQIFEYSAMNRKCGYTTMMLRAAMYKPECVIVARDEKGVEQIRRQYDTLYNETFKPKSARKRITIKLLIWLNILEKPKTKPTFISINKNLRGTNKPFFFDNSCFMY